jgi:hypothetical protein
LFRGANPKNAANARWRSLAIFADRARPFALLCWIGIWPEVARGQGLMAFPENDGPKIATNIAKRNLAIFDSIQARLAGWLVAMTFCCVHAPGLAPYAPNFLRLPRLR